MIRKVYLDYAAATPMDEKVLAAMQPYFSQEFYNPSAIYLAGRSVENTVHSSRTKISAILGCQASEIIFTAGGTEADNLAVYGVMSQFPNKKILISGLEHSSVNEPAKDFTAKEIRVLPTGVIDMRHLERSIDDDTVLISVLWASNELGTIQPIRKITELVEAVRRKRRQKDNKLPLLVHSDATQAAAWLDLNLNRSKLDLMTINGGKIYGPKQTGLLYVRRGIRLEPLIKGGGQENGWRSGSINVPGVVGLSAALDMVNQRRRQESERIVKLRDELEKQLLESVANLTVNCRKSKRLPSFSSLTFAGVDGERLVMELDELSVMTATGAACAASSDKPSQVLLSIGLSESQANSTLRLSLGYVSQKSDIDQAIKAIIKLTVKK